MTVGEIELPLRQLLATPGDPALPSGQRLRPRATCAAWPRTRFGGDQLGSGAGRSRAGWPSPRTPVGPSESSIRPRGGPIPSAGPGGATPIESACRHNCSAVGLVGNDVAAGDAPRRHPRLPRRRSLVRRIDAGGGRESVLDPGSRCSENPVASATRMESDFAISRSKYGADRAAGAAHSAQTARVYPDYSIGTPSGTNSHEKHYCKAASDPGSTIGGTAVISTACGRKAKCQGHAIA